MVNVPAVLDVVGKIEASKMTLEDIQKSLAQVRIAFRIHSPNSGVKIVKVGDEKRWCVSLFNFNNYAIPYEIPCVDALGDTISQAMEAALKKFVRVAQRQHEDEDELLD